MIKSKSDLAPTAAPSNALRMWSDRTRIFVELPGPHVLAFPLTEGGLSKALKLLTTQTYDFSGVSPIMTSPLTAQVEGLLRKHKVI